MIFVVDYSSVKIQRILNSELADTLGNLLNRCSGTLVNPGQIFPAFCCSDFDKYCGESAKELVESLETLPGFDKFYINFILILFCFLDLVDNFYSNYEFYKGVDSIVATLHLANAFFEREKPWELRKHSEFSDKLSVILHVTMETLRVSNCLPKKKNAQVK